MNKKPKRLDTPQPVAKPGERVRVQNYRFRPWRWECGTVASAKYTLSERGGSWSYDIHLDRLTTRGQWMWLYVEDSQLERLP